MHRLVDDRPLWLCGVRVPHTHGLLGHSDADVAIHALCDALLGALALGDIGQHFPDSDPRYKGIDSTRLLAEVCRMVAERGWTVSNIDITIAAQAPKLRPFIDDMRRRLAEVMQLAVDRISVKATTTEHLGFEGRREGISATATALIINY